MPALSTAPVHIAVKLALEPGVVMTAALVATPESGSVVVQPAVGTPPVGYVAPLVSPVTATTGGVLSTLTAGLLVAVAVVPATVSASSPDCTVPASVQVKATCTSYLVQVSAVYGLPLAVALAVIVGFVLSTLMPPTVVEAVLPAWSTACPSTD